MADQDQHSNRSPNQEQVSPEPGFACLIRRYCGWVVVAAILLLAGMLWTTGDINAAGQPAKAEASVSVVAVVPTATGEAESPGEDDAEPEKKGDNSDKDEEESDKGGEEAEKLNKEMEEAEKEIFELFEKFANASEKDPDSEETKALEKAMDEVIVKHQKLMERAMEVGKLPAAPAEKDTAKPKDTKADEKDKKPEAVKKPEAAKKPVEVKPAVKPDVKAPEKAVVVPKPAVKTPPVVPVKSVEPVQGQAAGDKVVTEIRTAPAGVDPSSGGVKVGTGKAKVAAVLPSPDDIVKIKMEDNLVDIAQLIDTIGIELKFNFLYDDTEPVKGKVLLQQHGKIRRRDLLPLLEGLLKFKGYVMVREDPFIRIIKRAQVDRVARPLINIGSEMPEVKPGDSVITQIIEIKHVPINELTALLGKFTDKESFTRINNTNYLIITDYVKQLPRVLEIIALVDQPGPIRELTILDVKYLDAKGIKAEIDTLVKALAGEVSGAAGAKANEPGRKVVRPGERPKPGDRSRPGAPGGISAAKVPEYFMYVDVRTNRLIVIATQEQTKQIRELLLMLDVETGGPEIILVPLEVKHIKASGANTQISALLKSLNEQGGAAISSQLPPPRGSGRIPPRTQSRSLSGSAAQSSKIAEKADKGPYLHVDDRTNRLLVVGSAEQVGQVKELLALLDVVEGPEIKLEVIRVEHVEAGGVSSKVEAIIQALNKQGATGGAVGGAPTPGRGGSIPGRSAPKPPPGRITPGVGKTSRGTENRGPAIFVDERTNRLFVVGSDEQIVQVKELLALFDVKEGPEIKLVAIRVEYVAADEVAGQMEALIEALSEQGGGGSLSSRGQAGRSQPVSGRSAPVLPRGGVAKPAPGGSRGAAGGGGLSGVLEVGPAIFVDERTNRLLIVGSDDQIGQVHELLGLLDVPEGPEIKLVVIEVEHVLAGDVASQVEKLIDALYEQGAQGISGRPRNLGRDQILPRQVNQPATPTGARDSRTNRTGSRSGQSEYQGPAIFVDERTNRMLVVGSEEQIVQVKQLLLLLDVEKGPAIRLAIIEVKYILADEVSEQLSELIDALADQSGSVTRVQTSMSGRSGRSGSDAFSNRSGTRSVVDNNRLGGVDNARSGRSSSRRAGSSESLNPGPFIMVDFRTNRLLVVGSDEHIEQCENLLTVLDVPPSEYHKLRLRIYQPEYVEAAEVQKILDELGITKSDTMAPRTRARQGEGPGPTTGISRISSTVGGDGLATGSERVFSVAGEGGQLLPGQEEPEVRVAIQETSNRIFILATEYQLSDIEEILKHVDVEPREDMSAIRIYPLKNRDPEVVAEMLQQLLIDPIEQQISEGQSVMVPGREDAPVIVPFTDIYAIGVRGSKKRQEEIKTLIDALDKRKPQVLLEAILVQVNASDALKLGISLQQAWDTGGSRNANRTFSTSSPFGISAAKAGSIVTGSGATLAFFDNDLVFATLEALQTEGNSKIMSMPRVLVNHNEPGSIVNQRSEPTTKTTVPAGSDTPIIEFDKYVEAGTTLEITPLISEGGLLELEISLDVSSFDGLGTQNVPPPKTENKIKTKVMVPNGKYIILGGLTSRTNSLDVNKIPILGDIPILGALFQSVARSESDAVLYIFVRANIVREESFDDLYNVTDKYKRRLRESEINYDEQSAETLPGIPDRRHKSRKTLEDE